MGGCSQWSSVTALVVAFTACVACGSGFHTGSGTGGTSDEAGPPAASNDASSGGASGAGGRATQSGGSGNAAGGHPFVGGADGGPDRPGTSGNDAGASADAGLGDANISEGGPGPVESAYRVTILGDHPRVYWRMGITSGRTVPDETGGGNDLVLQGSGHMLDVAGAIKADSNGAMGFDGVASFAIAANARVLDFAGNAAFSLECWARRTNGGSSYFQYLLSNLQGSANDRNGFTLYLLPEPAAGDSPRSVFEYDRPANDLGIWGPLAAESSWAHYVAVYDGAEALIYVNGTLADMTEVQGSITARTGSFAVARGSDNNGFFFKGALDEIAVYPRALAASDVARHFEFAR